MSGGWFLKHLHKSEQLPAFYPNSPEIELTQVVLLPAFIRRQFNNQMWFQCLIKPAYGAYLLNPMCSGARRLSESQA